MKHKYDDFSILTDFDNLYNAYKKARKGTTWKDGVAKYDQRALECTLAVKRILEDGKFNPKVAQEFYVYEPKKRKIVASEFYLKVIQRCLVDEILMPTFQKKVIKNNYASQKGKGIDVAINELAKDFRKFYRKNGTDGFIVKGDIKHFSLPPGTTC